ncbi:MAG: YdcF family protein [Acetobacteraceae bacterium]|nr:YdcF family protein [Acetobacteraceae bacterium]
MTAAVPQTRLCRAALRRGLLALSVILVAFAVAAWYGRALLLRSAADFWIESDPIGPADAVAVFGGGLGDRPFAAANYYRRGLVKRIVISNVHESPAEGLGVLLPDTAANRAVLLKLGVPEGDIETFGADLSSTREEALALRDWAARERVHSIIVPTEIFAARRLRWMLHRVFGNDLVIRVPALDPPEYRDDDWWRHERGIIGFQNELIKYVYYRLKY